MIFKINKIQILEILRIPLILSTNHDLVYDATTMIQTPRTIILFCLLLSAPLLSHADSRSVGLARALKAKQQIEHLDSYLEALLPETAPVKGSVSDIYLYNPKNWASIDYIDEGKIPEIARATVEANPFTTPTLHLFKFTFGKGRTEESFKTQPDIRFYPQKVVDQWMAVSKRYLATAAPIEKREKYIATRNKIVKAIYDAGGRVMAGSDTPEWLLL